MLNNFKSNFILFHYMIYLRSADPSSKYHDKFREKNLNNLRHLFKDKQIDLNNILWESHLRNYNGEKPCEEEYDYHFP